ncbi:MAG: UDP-N-acetylglucosamine 1-carboxyvinyltransferase [Defluviitaleaceae bacterium]|nr:UDP-N-acetylglucosamine 1-carboxyvinyltransferase [Defluviitaleaceae bacterium]
MECIVINGGRRLEGEVSVSGAKNAAVAIIPAAIAANDICVIENLPYIEDVDGLTKAMSQIGAICTLRDDHTLEIDSRNINHCCATYDSVRKIRASYYLLGVLLGRFGRAEVPLPGGCNFGVRPIDQHIKGLTAMGAKVNIEHGIIKARADRLVGTNVYLDVVSVGATINIMLAAIYAEGVTVIENAAKEPHVVDTANFLNILGAKVKGAGTDVIRVTGVSALHGGTYTIIPDQIEAGTYMVAAAITGGDVTVHNIIPKHMESVISKLGEMNCRISTGADFVRVRGNDNLTSVNVKTMPYPGFPTDLQPQMTALLCKAKGTGILTETVWENRFQYINELKRLGANIKVDGRTAVVSGEAGLTGALVNATDLRAGAALVVAALAAKGETVIGNVRYIDRGYERIENKLGSLGADIQRVDRLV